jgi:tetratricopeptide (TPR) repeat protein
MLGFDVLRHVGDMEAGREGLKEARAVAERSGNRYIEAWTSFWSGLASVHAEDWTAAWRHYERALPYFRRLPYKIPLQWTLDHLSHVTLQAGDLASSRAFTEEGIALSRATGLAKGDSNYPSLLGTASAFERSLGNHAQAAMYLQEAVDLLERSVSHSPDYYDSDSRPHVLAATQGRLAAARSILGEIAEALRLLDTAIETTRGLTTVQSTSGFAQDPPDKSIARATARVAFESGLHREAAVLLGASGDVDEEAVPAPLRSGIADQLRSQLGEDFAAAIEEGAAHADPLDLAAQTIARIRELPAGWA